MPDCSLMKDCSLFVDKICDMPSTAKFIKSRYCKEEGSSACARYVVFEKLGRDKVPQDLLPSEMDRIAEILDDLDEI